MKFNPFHIKEINSDFKGWLEKFFRTGYPEIGLEIIPYGFKNYRFNLYSYKALFMEIDLFKINEGYKVDAAQILFREGIPAFLHNLELQLRADGYATAKIYDNAQWIDKVYEFGVKGTELEDGEKEAKNFPPGAVDITPEGKYYAKKNRCPYPPIYEYEDRLLPVPGSDEPAPQNQPEPAQPMTKKREYDMDTKRKYQKARNLIKNGMEKKMALVKADINARQYKYWKDKEEGKI